MSRSAIIRIKGKLTAVIPLWQHSIGSTHDYVHMIRVMIVYIQMHSIIIQSYVCIVFEMIPSIGQDLELLASNVFTQFGQFYRALVCIKDINYRMYCTEVTNYVCNRLVAKYNICLYILLFMQQTGKTLLHACFKTSWFLFVLVMNTCRQYNVVR